MARVHHHADKTQAYGAQPRRARSTFAVQDVYQGYSRSDGPKRWGKRHVAECSSRRRNAVCINPALEGLETRAHVCARSSVRTANAGNVKLHTWVYVRCARTSALATRASVICGWRGGALALEEPAKPLVRERHCLGHGGGARGEHDDREVVGVKLRVEKGFVPRERLRFTAYQRLTCTQRNRANLRRATATEGSFTQCAVAHSDAGEKGDAGRGSRRARMSHLSRL
eukprot:6183170-Pleurochrysis_carterae.AAC.2